MNNTLTIKTYITDKNVQDRIKALLNDRASQFLVTVTTMANNDVKLAECEPKSLVSAALTAVGMNLPLNPNLGYVYIIPYKDKKAGITYAQLQFGYKAFIQLAMRSQQYKTLNVSEVKEGEYHGINRLTGELDLSWIAENRESIKVMGYVSYFKLTNGFEKSLYMSVDELKKHATKFSKSYTSQYAKTNLWKDDFDSMAKKTVIKLLLSKFGPMSADMARVQETDQAIVDGDKLKYIDNEKQTPDEVSEEKERVRLINYIQGCISVAELEKCLTSCDGETMQLYEDKLAELKGGETE